MSPSARQALSHRSQPRAHASPRRGAVTRSMTAPAPHGWCVRLSSGGSGSRPRPRGA